MKLHFNQSQGKSRKVKESQQNQNRVNDCDDGELGDQSTLKCPAIVI